METLKNQLSEFKINFKHLPLDLKFLFWFSLALGIGGKLFKLISVKELYEKVIPYTGWSPGSHFLFISVAIFFVYSSGKSNVFDRLLKCRRSVVGLLVLELIFGVYDWLEVLPEDFSKTNPYLRYEPLRPLYAVFLPLLWIMIAKLRHY